MFVYACAVLFEHSRFHDDLLSHTRQAHGWIDYLNKHWSANISEKLLLPDSVASCAVD